jgi:iron complex outermembrane receptor protein
MVWSDGMTTKALLLATTAVGIAAFMAPAGAQQASQLEDIVVVAKRQGDEPAKGPDDSIVAKNSASALKLGTSLLETPQVVNVVTRPQMEAQGANSVAQALRYTPGVNAEPNGYDIRYDWLDIRGFNTFGNTWLDGLMLPGDPAGYATPSINLYALERVEVIKGPASVLYGRTIPGGLVNLVSKRPQAETYREASVQTSTFGGIQGAVDMTGKITQDGQWLYRFTALGKDLNTQIDHEHDRQIMLAPSITWAPTDDTNLTLYGYYQRDTPVFSPRFYPATGTLLPNPAGQIPRDVFLGDPDFGNFDRTFYALGYEFEHSFNDTWTVRQNLRYAHSDQDMNLALVNPAFAYSAPGTVLDRVTAISDDTLTSFAVDNQAEARFQTGAFEHTALFGLDYIRSSSDTKFGNTGWGVSVPPIDYLNPIYGLPFPIAPVTRSGLQKQDQLGLYAQDQVRYDNWVGTFGLRYDFSDISSDNRIAGTNVNTNDQALSGRAGLTYLFDNGLAPYVSFMSSFQPMLGTTQAGDPFSPQTATQYEIGVKYEPANGRGMIGVSVFDLTTENSLTPDITNTLYSVQSGKSRVRGIEFEGKYEITPSLEVIAGYAYSNSEILESSEVEDIGRPMLRLPEHQGAVWMRYQPDFAPGLALSAGVRATSSYQTSPAYLEQLEIPARALVDIGAEVDFGALSKEFEGTQLRVNVTNLFDKTYVSHCLNATGGSCNYGAGRAITANLKYAW